MNKGKENLFRVRFQTKDDKEATEVVVRSLGSSEFLGLLALEDFVFNDQKKQVILPAEDNARKKFSNINRLHIPYHNILLVEEFTEQATDLTKLPFIKEVSENMNNEPAT